LTRIGLLLEMIKFEHSVFALPFALTAVFLATAGRPGGMELLWIVVAMVGARSLAMTLNRLLDKSIDGRNPRTAGRALPSGLLSSADAWAFGALSLTFLLLAVYRLDPLCRYLWPPLVGLFLIYPYTKRFTWWCHFVLGACLGLAPVGAWIAVTGTVASPIWLLGAAVTLWTAGFDIIYACQDVEIDRREGLHSIPARFGITSSLRLARLLHVFSFLFFIATGLAFHLTAVYYIGLLAVALLLTWEHRLVSADDLSKLDMAFFTMNGVIAFLFFLFTAVDLTFGRMA
jgi:4-hydroxybenzoate polyprenyltransferase